MRILQNIEYPKQFLKVREHLILANFWEYYVVETEIPHEDDVQLCYVLGFENELGYVSMAEIRPYVVRKTSDMFEILPAEGYNWNDEQKKREV